MVYVQDFKIEKGSTGNDQQTLGGGRARALIAEAKSATGMQSSQVVDLMSSSLISDLNRGGVKAQRLAVGESLPRNGWLVRGVFAEVDQGSRVLRSQVGFGAGATDLAVLVNVADLQKGKVQPFYKLEAQAGSRKMPGAAVTRNPYVGLQQSLSCPGEICRRIFGRPHRPSLIKSFVAPNRRKSVLPDAGYQMPQKRHLGIPLRYFLALRFNIWSGSSRLPFREFGSSLCLERIKFLHLVGVQILRSAIAKIGLQLHRLLELLQLAHGFVGFKRLSLFVPLRN